MRSATSDAPASGPVIGVLIPLTAGMYFGSILKGISRAIVPEGGRVIAVQTMHRPQLNEEHVFDSCFDQAIAWDHVDGFIVVGDAVPRSYFQAIEASGKPLVVISHVEPGLSAPVVLPDNRKGTRQAVQHLIDHGHTRVAFVGFMDLDDVRERYEEYLATLQDAGLPAPPELVIEVDDAWRDGGRVAARRLLAAGMPATAVMAATDLTALGLIDEMARAGVSLPRDLAVMGFDDAPDAVHCSPRLSTVRQDLDTVGATAVQVFRQQLQGAAADGRVQYVPTSMVLRESCGCGSDQGGGALPESFGADEALEDLRSGLLAAIAVRDEARPLAPASPVAGALTVVVGHFSAALAGAPPPAPTELRPAMEALVEQSVRPIPAPALLGALLGFRRKVTSSGLDRLTRGRVQEAVAAAAQALLYAESRAATLSQSKLVEMLVSQYQVAMDVLRDEGNDPRSLGWLSRTKTVAGALGLWTGADMQTLRVAGAYRADNGVVEIGQALAEPSFPPRFILDQPHQPGEVAFAVPVRNAARHWGWLVTVGEALSLEVMHWEAHNQWAALLSVALEEKDAAEKLSAAQREWHAILEGTPDAIVRFDTAGRYEYLNAAAAAMIGFAPEEIIGRTDAELGRQAEVVERWAAGLQRVLANQQPLVLETEQTQDGERRWYEVRMVPQFARDGALSGVLTSSRETTAAKNAQLALARHELHDGLTGAANRALFVDRLTHAVSRAEQSSGPVAVLFVDVDHFKHVNDTLGRDAGDQVLVEVATRLSACSPMIDTVARLGGDEFLVLCDVLTSDGDVATIAEAIVATLRQPFTVGGAELGLTSSVGVALGSSTANPDGLVRNADTAMFAAKSRGGDRFQLFDPDLEKRVSTLISIENDLRHAVGRGELRLVYQPVFDLRSGAISGVEALVRWQHPERGLVMPDAFIPIAEQYGLIVPIGTWVLDEACRQMAAWRSAGMDGLRMAVNISPRQLSSFGLVEVVADVLRRHDVEPSMVTLEITETALLGDTGLVSSQLESVASLGVKLALDDFGTGYSALAHLKDFPVDILKVDRSFVSQLAGTGRADQIVGALVAMAHFLGLTVVGEGVETTEQWRHLEALGCDFGQGYLVSKPVPPSEIPAIVGQRGMASPPIDELVGRALQT